MKSLKYIGLSLAIALGLGFSGCAGVEPKSISTYHDNNLKAGVSDLKIPELNIQATAEIGSNIYEKARIYISDTYKVHINQPIDLQSGLSGLFKSSSTNLGYLSIDNANNWKSACTQSSNGYLYCLFDTDNNSNFDKFGAKMNSLYSDIDQPIPYTSIPTEPEYKQDSFKYQALYQGKSGNKIKISFREFKNDMARPAFTQDIEYELDKDGTAIIGFKGLRVEIIKATNMDITYKVVKDYN